MTGTRPAARVTELPTEWIREHMHEVLEIYGLAMGYDPGVVAGRYGYAIPPTERQGFHAVGAFAPTPEGEQLVGFGYGYLVAPGQWWHDQVRAALDRRTAKRWLPGAFEVCELHVRPAHQGTGLGRDLLTTLLAGQPGGTAVLTTPDLETRARGCYRAQGWVDLRQGLRFPGDPRVFAVLGLRLGSSR